MNAIEHNPLCGCQECQFDIRFLIAANNEKYAQERPKVVRFPADLTKARGEM